VREQVDEDLKRLRKEKEEAIEFIWECFQQFVIKRDGKYINDYMTTTEELGIFLVKKGMLKEVDGGWIKSEVGQ